MMTNDRFLEIGCMRWRSDEAPTAESINAVRDLYAEARRARLSEARLLEMTARLGNFLESEFPDDYKAIEAETFVDMAIRVLRRYKGPTSAEMAEEWRQEVELLRSMRVSKR